MKKIILLILVLLFTLQCKTGKNETQSMFPQNIAGTSKFPKPLGYVSDYEGIFTEPQIKELNKILSDYDSKTSNQIAIVSINKNITEENFYQYALDLSRNWGVGAPHKNNGLTIIFSKKLRAIRISTGTGTEKILTDQICEEVLNKKILPEFRNENYFNGIKNGVESFITLWK